MPLIRTAIEALANTRRFSRGLAVVFASLQSALQRQTGLVQSLQPLRLHSPYFLQSLMQV